MKDLNKLDGYVKEQIMPSVLSFLIKIEKYLLTKTIRVKLWFLFGSMVLRKWKLSSDIDIGIILDQENYSKWCELNSAEILKIEKTIFTSLSSHRIEFTPFSEQWLVDRNLSIESLKQNPQLPTYGDILILDLKKKD